MSFYNDILTYSCFIAGGGIIVKLMMNVLQRELFGTVKGNVDLASVLLMPRLQNPT